MLAFKLTELNILLLEAIHFIALGTFQFTLDGDYRIGVYGLARLRSMFEVLCLSAMSISFFLYLVK